MVVAHNDEGRLGESTEGQLVATTLAPRLSSLFAAPFILTHQPAFRQDVSFEGPEHVRLEWPWPSVDAGIESIQPEEITMGTARGARPAIADIAEVVFALSCGLEVLASGSAPPCSPRE